MQVESELQSELDVEFFYATIEPASSNLWDFNLDDGPIKLNYLYLFFTYNIYSSFITKLLNYLFN